MHMITMSTDGSCCAVLPVEPDGDQFLRTVELAREQCVRLGQLPELFFKEMVLNVRVGWCRVDGLPEDLQFPVGRHYTLFTDDLDMTRIRLYSTGRDRLHVSSDSFKLGCVLTEPPYTSQDTFYLYIADFRRKLIEAANNRKDRR